MARVGVVAMCAALLVISACSGQETAAPATTVPTTTSTTTTTTMGPRPVGTSPANVSTGPGTGPRHVEITAFTLAAGETIGVALHPSKAPVTLSSATPGLEVCPATTDGTVDPSLNGWPEPGFKTCRPFDAGGQVSLPPVSAATFHLAVVVRPTTPGAVTIDKLVLDYEAVDGYFLVLGPPIPPGAISPDVSVTPLAFTSVRAKATDPRSGRRWPETIGVEVLQGNRLVESNESTEPERRGRVYGPLNVGFPVTAHVRNGTDEPVLAQLWLEWT